MSDPLEKRDSSAFYSETHVPKKKEAGKPNYIECFYIQTFETIEFI